MDFFSNVESMLTTLTGRIQAIALSAIILCIVIVGAMFLFGEGPSRAAKRWLGWIIVGAILIFGAATIAQTVQTTLGF